MSLQFVYGRAGSGKTRHCLNEIKSRIINGIPKPMMLLVPEQFTFQAERDLISVLGTGGILKTEVLSFRRLAFRVFNEAGGITYPHIHPAGKSMILYRILDNMRSGFKVFAGSLDREGFVSTVSSLITEFKRYNVHPEYLQKVSLELDEGHPLKGKLNELNLIYEEFEKTLAERYRDSDDDLTLAAQKLESTNLFEGSEIWIDGFASFTPQEYRIIEKLLKKSDRVTISFCTDSPEDGELKETDIFRSTKQAYRKLVSLAHKSNVPVEKDVFLESDILVRFKLSPELSHLEKNLNSYPYQAYKGETKDISLFTAVNIFSEIEEAARCIIGLCRDKGLRYRDIAVAARNLKGYEKLVEVIFSEYGIPCFIDQKVEIGNHPLVRLVLSMLDIFIDNWSYESVFRYLKTGLTNIEQDDIDALENYVLACGIRGAKWTGDEDWNMVPELIPDEKARESGEKLLENINRIRAGVSAPLLAFRQKIRGRRTASEFCGSLYDFLCHMGIPERISSIIEGLRQKGELSLANEYSQVWNILMEVFDQAVEVMAEENFGLERFSSLLKIGLSEYKIGLIPASLDQVTVGSVERSRSHEIKAMLLLGVNDGVFPSSAAKEGILSDQERILLNHMGLELASDTRSQAFDEQYLVYRVLTTAASFLRVSWPVADSEGKTMRPSVIISRLRKLFPKITERSNIMPSSSISGEIELIASKNPAFRHMVLSLRQKADGKNINPIWLGVYKWFTSDSQWKEECNTAREAFRYRNLAQSIGSDKIGALYGEPAVSSVSRLEKYTACPFAFYVQYGLGAKERKIFRLSPPDIGTFMHAVIESFSRLVAKGDITWRSFDREWCYGKVSEIINEMLQKMQGSGISASKRYTVLASRLKRVVGRAVWLIAEHIRRSSFNPVEYETGFGPNEKYPPITIQLDSGEEISLTGRIDRIDALKTEEGTYLRIIDYKSGTKDFKLSDVFYGLQIQLITYLDAIWENGGNDPESRVFPGGMLYFKIDDPIIKGNAKAAAEEVEAAIMRQLKMKGLLLADVRLIKEMDNTIDGSSMIIPATVNKGDVLGKNTSGATLEQFIILKKYVRRLLKNLCSEIMKGNVSIKPYKKKGITSCSYCSFLPVCQFDISMKDNAFKLLYDIKDEELWDLMENSCED